MLRFATIQLLGLVRFHQMLFSEHKMPAYTFAIFDSITHIVKQFVSVEQKWLLKEEGESFLQGGTG